MKVSVITCTYNRPNTLTKTIRSVLTQNYKNLELIIVDDGSSKETSITVQKFNNKMIRYFYKKNSGLFDSMNYGLQKSTGELICFLDDDDIFLPNKLSNQVKFMQNNSQAAACFSDYIVKKGKINKRISLRKKEKDFFFQYLQESFLTNNCLLLRAEFFKNTKLNINLSTSADYDWFLTIASKKPFLYCPGKPVAIYIRHKSNMTNNKENLKTVIGIIKKHYIKNKKIFIEKEKKILESNILFREGKLFFWKNNYLKARKKFYNSFKKDASQFKSLIFIMFTFLGERIFNLFIPFYEFFARKIYIKDSS